MEDENRFFLLEEWDTEENLMAHMKTEHFRITLGAMNLLQEPYERNHFTIKPIRKELTP
jgi:quinol monooxygenase YgiN